MSNTNDQVALELQTFRDEWRNELNKDAKTKDEVESKDLPPVQVAKQVGTVVCVQVELLTLVWVRAG